jgi:hypothetical protein
MYWSKLITVTDTCFRKYFGASLCIHGTFHACMQHRHANEPVALFPYYANVCTYMYIYIYGCFIPCMDVLFHLWIFFRCTEVLFHAYPSNFSQRQTGQIAHFLAPRLHTHMNYLLKLSESLIQLNLLIFNQHQLDAL